MRCAISDDPGATAEVVVIDDSDSDTNSESPTDTANSSEGRLIDWLCSSDN